MRSVTGQRVELASGRAVLVVLASLASLASESHVPQVHVAKVAEVAVVARQLSLQCEVAGVGGQVGGSDRTL